MKSKTPALFFGIGAGLAWVMFRDRRDSGKSPEKPGETDRDGMFKQARYYTKGRKTRPIWIVIHTAETAEGPHVAEGLAEYAATTPDARQVSWHYAIDSNSTTASVREEDTAWAAGPANSRGVHIELAGRASQGASGWADPYSTALLERAAALVAEIAGRWQIPIVHPTREEVLALGPGVIGHDQVSWASGEAKRRNLRVDPWFVNGAWKGTNHTDPGPSFPWDHFLALVRARAKSGTGI